MIPSSVDLRASSSASISVVMTDIVAIDRYAPDGSDGYFRRDPSSYVDLDVLHIVQKKRVTSVTRGTLADQRPVTDRDASMIVHSFRH